MPWGPAIAGVATAVGGAVASTSAANTQAGATRSATNAELGMFNTTQSNLGPFAQTGAAAEDAVLQGLGLGAPPLTQGQRVSVFQMLVDKYGGDHAQAGAEFNARMAKGPAGFADMIGGIATPDTSSMEKGAFTKPFTLADFQSSPGYAFQQQQGIQAIDSSASAKGFTGNTLKDLMTFGQGLANQDWWNAYNAFTGRQKTLYDMFSGVAGAGQDAAANLGAIGTKVGGQIGDNITSAGAAQAAGTVGASNAFTGGINNAATNYFLYQLMQQNQNQPSPSTAGYY